jgi:hypothetical protein
MNSVQIQKLLSKLPEITGWINAMLASHANKSQPVASFGFRRLPGYYSPQLLAQAKVVVVEHVPIPPLTALGLPEFADFEQGDYVGITFKDTYFVKAAAAGQESLHFHELVRVVQWAHLGVKKLLTAYAEGLAVQGYRNSPLEVMAYDLQDYFDQNGPPGDVVATVRNKLNELYP